MKPKRPSAPSPRPSNGKSSSSSPHAPRARAENAASAEGITLDLAGGDSEDAAFEAYSGQGPGDV